MTNTKAVLTIHVHIIQQYKLDEETVHLSFCFFLSFFRAYEEESALVGNNNNSLWHREGKRTTALGKSDFAKSRNQGIERPLAIVFGSTYWSES